ncbi:P-loop containing nucleoside triphosphate hydrolase protein, partial [Caulochytrium protostelioides]
RVAVDGPSATGKSDSAQQLAQRLGFLYVDSGALFRALALALSSKLLPASNPSAIAAYLTGPENPVPRIQWTFPPGRIMLNGHDVSLAIRTDEITQKASEYAVLPAVREALIGLQRHIGVDDPNVRGVVMDGRDIGTTVFPDADAKLFLDGDVHVRAARR